MLCYCGSRVNHTIDPERGNTQPRIGKCSRFLVAILVNYDDDRITFRKENNIFANIGSLDSIDEHEIQMKEHLPEEAAFSIAVSRRPDLSRRDLHRRLYY